MFLPDFPMMYGEMTVLKHLAMLLRIYGRIDEGIEGRIIEILQELDLLPLIDMPMGKLSRGQIYKCALAGLLAVDPELWLLDEPFASGMDPHGISFFKREARAAADRGRTVIYSTQILDVAENLSDQVCIIDKGELRICAPVAELQEKGSMVVPGGILEDVFQKMREESR
jgi:ABC-2 type transport system ATP-binding protein